MLYPKLKIINGIGYIIGSVISMTSSKPTPKYVESFKQQSEKDIKKQLEHQTIQLMKKALRGGPKCPKI